MNKYSIASVVVLLNASLFASTLNWGLMTDEVLDAEKVNAGTMYLVWTANESAIKWTELTKMTSYGESSLSKVGFEKNVASFSYSATSISTSSSVVPADLDNTAGSHNFYMICIDDDAKDIAYTTVAKGGNITGTSMSVSLKNTADAFSYAHAAAVPEPFSGSLALLGVGLVALRRKMKKQKK